jgi:type II secretory pathway component PulJ
MGREWDELYDHRTHNTVRNALNKRLLREEGGFTLVEIMITILIMIIVLFALYSMFDMSVKLYSFGNSKAEAMENARLGMEKMERELRQAYAFDKGKPTTSGGPDTRLFDTWTATQITFGNDLDGNMKSGSTAGECPNINGDCELISYSLDGGSLMRTSGDPPGPQPVVENVEDIDDPPDGEALRFTYFERDGTTEVLPGGNEALIGMVRIEVEVRVDSMGPQDGTQTLTTDVALRNRGD